MSAKTTRAYAEQQGANPLVSAILSAEDLDYEDVTVPEWGGVTVRVRALDGTARDAYEASLFAIKSMEDTAQVEAKMGNRRARLLCKCLFDPETNERLPIKPEQLGGKSSAVLDRLHSVALRLSGMTTKGRSDVKGN